MVCWTTKDQRNVYKLQREHENKSKTKQKQQKEGTITQSTCQKKIEQRHSMERVQYTASRELSDTPPPPRSKLSPICTQAHSIYNSVLSGFRVSLSAQSAPLGEALERYNQRGSKTSQAFYSHFRCNTNLVCFFRFSLPLPVFGRLFPFLHQCGHKRTAFTYCAAPDPKVKSGSVSASRDAKYLTILCSAVRPFFLLRPRPTFSRILQLS